MGATKPIEITARLFGIAASIKVPAFAYLRGYDQDIGRNAERTVIFYYIDW